MSDNQNKYSRFEQQIRDFFADWTAPFSASEAKSDWEAVQRKMQPAEPTGSQTPQAGSSNFFLAGIVITAAIVSGYLLYTLMSPAPEIAESIDHGDAHESIAETEEMNVIESFPGLTEAYNPDFPIKEETQSIDKERLSIPKAHPKQHPPQISRETTSSTEAENMQPEPESSEEGKSGDNQQSNLDYLSGNYVPPSAPPGDITGPAVNQPTDNFTSGGSGYSGAITTNDSIYCNPRPDDKSYEMAGQFIEPGQYTIPHVRERNGTIDTVERNLIVPKPVIADFEIKKTNPPRIYFKQSSKNAYKFTWYFGDGRFSYGYEPSHNYTDTGKFRVMMVAENTYGCVDTAYKTIGIYPEPELDIPNAFSPDGTGINETFFVNIEGESYFNLRIFDRNGRLVFESDDKTRAWDGTYSDNNKDCPAGTYYYILEYQWMGESETRTEKGSISLHR